MRLFCGLRSIMFGLVAGMLVAAPLAAQTTTGTDIVTVQTFRATNVRSGPSVSFDIIEVLDQGQIVEAVGRSDVFSNWIQVNLGSRRGWVAYFTVAVDGQLTTLPIVNVTAATPTPTIVPAIPASQSALTAPNSVYVTAYRRVNVRTGPGTEFSVLGVLDVGQTASVIGSSGEANEWLQIDLNGEPGWVAYFVVTVSGDVAQLDADTFIDDDLNATTDDTPSAGSLALNQVIVITRFNTNLRVEPVLGSEVITIIPYETTLQALARTEDNRWLQVRSGNQVGWMISSLLNMGVSDIDALPVYTPEDGSATQSEALPDASM